MFPVPRPEHLEFPSCKMGSWGQRGLKTQRLVPARILMVTQGPFRFAMPRTGSFWDCLTPRQIPISSQEGPNAVPWRENQFLEYIKKCLFFFLTMWEQSFEDMPRKLKFEVQLDLLRFWVVNIVSHLFSPSSTLLSEDRACISCPITGKPSLFKRLQNPSFGISCTRSAETNNHFNCLRTCLHL